MKVCNSNHMNAQKFGLLSLQSARVERKEEEEEEE